MLYQSPVFRGHSSQMIPNPICFLLVSSHPIVNFEVFPTAFRKKNPQKNTPLNLAFIASRRLWPAPQRRVLGRRGSGRRQFGFGGRGGVSYRGVGFDTMGWVDDQFTTSFRRLLALGCVDIARFFCGWELGWSQGKKHWHAFFEKWNSFKRLLDSVFCC